MTLRQQATWFALALILFGVPLYLGLGRSDLENDEAIYSYAVNRALDTHEWLTPRGIYDDGAFLEKPPLKEWIVEAGIAMGLPRDEAGLRFFDPLFGILAFGYVFGIGRRLSGALCGTIAVGIGGARCGFVSYEVKSDGTLDGVWGGYGSEKTGTEKATKQ